MWSCKVLQKPTTFGHLRTLVSGQTVDTRCQELNSTHPPLETEGQRSVGLLTFLFDLWSSSCLLCTFGCRLHVNQQSCKCQRLHLQRDRWADWQAVSRLLLLVLLFLLSVCDSLQAWPGLGGLFLWSLGGPGCKLGFIAKKWMGQVPAVTRR